MALSPINRTNLLALDPNLAMGQVADPALRKAVFDQYADDMDTIIAAFNVLAAASGIGTTNIADFAVTTAKIALLAVTAAQIANGTITSTQLAPLAVESANLASGIDPVKLADGSVNATEFQFINSLSSNAQTQLDSKIPLAQKGSANGVVPLNASSKIDTTYIPDSILGQLEYQGTYNATTNVPTLPSASASKGFYYVISTGGTVSGTVYAIGDWIVSNGTTWEKVDNTDAVATVFGRTGAIVAAMNDYTWAQIDKTTSSLLDLGTRSASDLNTGTLPVGRVPTGIPATNIGTGAIDNAHLNFLADVTGLIQAQLNAKAPLTHVGAGGITQHPDATTSQSGFISVADLIAFRSLQSTTGLSSYSVPVGQVFPFWLRYSNEQDPVTGEWVIYEI